MALVIQRNYQTMGESFGLMLQGPRLLVEAADSG